MMKAILFDLDGTLLAGDLEGQLQAYLARIQRYADEKAPLLGRDLPKRIMGVTMECIRDTDTNATIREKFYTRYCAQTGIARAVAEPLFDSFYENEYGELGELLDKQPVPEVIEAVALAKKAGCTLVVATNCLYPRAAIQWRIRFAGLNPADFDLITDYAKMHCAKPHLAYYQEIAHILGLPPTACAMIGNNAVEDMAAAQTGMQTFLLTNYLLDDTPAYKGPRGDYGAMLDWLRETLGAE